MCCKQKHPTEMKLPIQTDMFKKIDEELYELHLKKNADYSPANVIVTGEIGVLIRIWDKFCRLCHLYGVTFPTPQPAILSIIDKIEKEKSGPAPHKYNIDEIYKELKEVAKQCELDFSKIEKKEALNEAIDDTWKDLTVYAKIGLMKHLNSWGR